MIVWTIYDHPRDSPDKFVVRAHRSGKGFTQPSDEATHHNTLEEARAAIPEGLVWFDRQPEDDKAILETWL
jgi:hypothetical protein